MYFLRYNPDPSCSSSLFLILSLNLAAKQPGPIYLYSSPISLGKVFPGSQQRNNQLILLLQESQTENSLVYWRVSVWFQRVRSQSLYFLFILPCNFFSVFLFGGVMSWVSVGSAQALSNCGEPGLLFVVVLRLLVVVASLFVEHGLEHTGFSSCGMWTRSLWCTGLVAPRHVAS